MNSMSPQAKPPSSAAGRDRRFKIVLGAVTAVAVVLNLLNADAGIAKGRGATYVLGVVPFALLAALVWMLWKKGTKHAVFTLIPLLAVLAVCELAFRVYFRYFASAQQRVMLASPVTRNLGSENIYRPHHYSVYNLNPNVNLPEGTRHNNLGLRDHRRFDKNDEKAIRIVFLGGSSTYTIDIRDNKKIFSAGLEAKLNAEYAETLGDRRIEVINAGMGGATSAENLIRLVFFISEVRPDLLVIQHGLNDVKARMQGTITSDLSNYRKAWSQPAIFASRDSVASCLTRRLCEYSMFGNFVLMTLRAYRPRKVSDYAVKRSFDEDTLAAIARNGPEYFRRNTSYMIALAREMGARVMLVTVPISDKASRERKICVPQHNAILAEVAKAKGALFYDFASEMTKDDEHMPDGRHVSQAGSDLKRDLFLAHFVRCKVIPLLLEPSAAATRPGTGE